MWRSKMPALFMLVELIERGRMAGADVLAVTMEAFGFEDEDVLPDEERPREDAPLFELVLPLLLIHLKYSIMDMGFHCQFVNERIKCMAQKIKRRYIRD